MSAECVQASLTCRHLENGSAIARLPLLGLAGFVWGWRQGQADSSLWNMAVPGFGCFWKEAVSMLPGYPDQKYKIATGEDDERRICENVKGGLITPFTGWFYFLILGRFFNVSIFFYFCMWVWSVVHVHVTVGMHAFVYVSVECYVCACHCVCVSELSSRLILSCVTFVCVIGSLNQSGSYLIC